jgi:hypothetical protein
MDEKDYSTGMGGTAAWKVIDRHTWQNTWKSNERTLSVETLTLGADGNTLIVTNKGTKPNGEPIDDSTTFQRVTAGSGLEGRWVSKRVNPGSTLDHRVHPSWRRPSDVSTTGVGGRVRDNVMAALFGEIEAGGMAAPPWPPFRAPTLGLSNVTVAGLLDVLRELASPRKEPADLPAGRVLDTQIEAQVHGPVDLQEDIELLVADPAFAPTTTGETLRELALRYGFPLRWHCGFRLAVGEVPDDFRGPEMPRLAHRIAGENGLIDAAVIGTAEASLHHRPEMWRDWGSREEVLQHLKQLWHVLVHYGAPAHRTTDDFLSD